MDNCTLYLSKFFCFASLIVTAKTGTCMTESGPRLELIRTPTSSSPVYPQQRVTVTCTTRESGIQVWRIDNYIVAGDTIEFLSRHLQETVITKTSIHDSEIIATLTCVDQENLILESTLSIVISPRPSTFNVTCVNNAWSIRDSITLHVLDMPAQKISSSLQGASACPGDRINFTCITYSSSILAWQSNYYLGKGGQVDFLSNDQEGKVEPSNIVPNTIAILNSISMENERTDITSTFSVIAPTDSTDDSRVINVTCINVDIGTKKTINFSLADDCSNDDSVTSQILPATVAINPGPDGLSSSDIGIIIAVIITFATSLLIITVIVIMIIFLNRRRNKLLLKNQQAMSTVLQSNISFGSQVILRIDEMAPKWRQFGMEIGIDNSVLDGIDQKVHSQYGALQKVIDYWVRNSTKKLQWSDVFIAVNAVKQENNSESSAGLGSESTDHNIANQEEDHNPADMEQGGSTIHRVNQEQSTTNPGPADVEQGQSTIHRANQEEKQPTTNPADVEQGQSTIHRANQEEKQSTTNPGPADVERGQSTIHRANQEEKQSTTNPADVEQQESTIRRDNHEEEHQTTRTNPADLEQQGSTSDTKVQLEVPLINGSKGICLDQSPESNEGSHY